MNTTIEFKKSMVIICTILLSSIIVTNIIDPSYDLIKLLSILEFYYLFMIIFSFLCGALFPLFMYSKFAGSVFGFGVSILLWFKYGQFSAKK